MEAHFSPCIATSSSGVLCCSQLLIWEVSSKHADIEGLVRFNTGLEKSQGFSAIFIQSLYKPNQSIFGFSSTY